jgi:predicted MFS family arabinose efflux permease
MSGGRTGKKSRLWLSVLAATVLLQAVSAFLTRVAPTIAPYLMDEVGLPVSAIGHLSAIGTVGSMVFLLIGAPIIRRFGCIRILQIGTAVAALGALMFLVPHAVAAVLAVLLIGLGYGPSPAAGSEVLQRYSPPDRRSLIFSVKQAGVPVGGMMAGLILPPAVLAFGVAGAVASCLVISVVAVALVQPLRAEVDAERSKGERIDIGSIFAAGNLLAPFRAVAASPHIAVVALAGTCFATGQGIWFAYLVTFMVLKLDCSLGFAGTVFAVMQATSIFGRIALGWLADRVGSGAVVLAVAGLASALCSIGLAMAQKSWPVATMFALSGLAGVAVSSWNGVQVAEVVRLSPQAHIHTTVAGATMVIFLGYVAGPILFAVLIGATGRYDLGFLAVAAVCTAGAVLALSARRAL